MSTKAATSSMSSTRPPVVISSRLPWPPKSQLSRDLVLQAHLSSSLRPLGLPLFFRSVEGRKSRLRKQLMRRRQLKIRPELKDRISSKELFKLCLSLPSRIPRPPSMPRPRKTESNRRGKRRRPSRICKLESSGVERDPCLLRATILAPTALITWPKLKHSRNSLAS